jgi:hypothetical protein
VKTAPPIRTGLQGGRSQAGCWLMFAVAAASLACRAETAAPAPMPRPTQADSGAGRAGSGGGGGGGGTPGSGPEGTAGSGGASGAGGTGGSATPDARPSSPDVAPLPPDAGSTADVAARGPVGNPKLDDLEDCEAAILANDGRAGNWYTYLDEFGSTLTPPMIMPEMGGAPGSTRCALHLRGRIMTNAAMMQYGFAGVGFSFAGTTPYDASGYDGITFWTRGTGQIRLGVAVPETTDVMFGGTCATGCGDAFGIVVEATQEWKKVEVRWSELFQAGWGTPATFDNRKMVGLDFGLLGPTFDVFIDEVAYLPPASGTTPP